MSKCLGGYQLIDLKGLSIGLDGYVTVPDQSALEYAIQLKKPVIIHNYVDTSSHFDGPVLLTYNADYKNFIAAVFDFTDTVTQAIIFITKDGEDPEWKVGVMIPA